MQHLNQCANYQSIFPTDHLLYSVPIRIHSECKMPILTVQSFMGARHDKLHSNTVSKHLLLNEDVYVRPSNASIVCVCAVIWLCLRVNFWRLCTFLADEERSYQARVNVFGCADVGVVESGQAVAFLRTGAVVLGEGPLVGQRHPRWHRVVALLARAGAIGVQGSCRHRGGNYSHSVLG